MKRRWRQSTLMLFVPVTVVAYATMPSLAVYLACAIDPAAIRQNCPQWSVNCEWPVQICFDEFGQATCGFAPLDSRTEYFYRGDPCQLDRDGVPGGSDGDPCTRDSCNFTARRCDHIPINGCFPPTSTPTPTPTRTPKPGAPRPTATQVAECTYDAWAQQWCPDSTCDMPTNAKCTWNGGPQEGVPCGVIDQTTIGTCCGTECKPISCTQVYDTEISSNPCASTHVDDDGNCALYLDTTCVRCLDGSDCPTGQRCDRSGGTFFGRCVAPTPTPAPCSCDCNGDGRVTVNELILFVNMALQQSAPDACRGVDRNHDGKVTVNELIFAVTEALSGCS